MASTDQSSEHARARPCDQHRRKGRWSEDAMSRLDEDTPVAHGRAASRRLGPATVHHAAGVAAAPGHDRRRRRPGGRRGVV